MIKERHFSSLFGAKEVQKEGAEGALRLSLRTYGTQAAFPLFAAQLVASRRPDGVKKRKVVSELRRS